MVHISTHVMKEFIYLKRKHPWQYVAKVWRGMAVIHMYPCTYIGACLVRPVGVFPPFLSPNLLVRLHFYVRSTHRHLRLRINLRNQLICAPSNQPAVYNIISSSMFHDVDPAMGRAQFDQLLRPVIPFYQEFGNLYGRDLNYPSSSGR